MAADRDSLRENLQVQWGHIQRGLRETDIPVTDKIKLLAEIHATMGGLLKAAREKDYDARFLELSESVVAHLTAAGHALGELIQLTKESGVTEQYVRDRVSYNGQLHLSSVSTEIASALGKSRTIESHFKRLLPNIVDRIGVLPTDSGS